MFRITIGGFQRAVLCLHTIRYAKRLRTLTLVLVQEINAQAVVQAWIHFRIASVYFVLTIGAFVAGQAFARVVRAHIVGHALAILTFILGTFVHKLITVLTNSPHWTQTNVRVNQANTRRARHTIVISAIIHWLVAVFTRPI